jgi:hypothetical protein
MKVFKLTDKDGYCRRGDDGETKYEVGKTYTSDGKGFLCTEHWRHAYEHPILAVLHDPIYGEYGSTARLWECEIGDGRVIRDGRMKLGTTALTLVREIPLPVLTTEQRVAYAIHCALRVYVEETFVCWAHNWLSGVDRSEKSVWAVKAEWASSVAAWSSRSAWSAVDAAESAAGAASWSSAAWSAWSAVRSASVEAKVDLLSCTREAGII